MLREFNRQQRTVAASVVATVTAVALLASASPADAQSSSRTRPSVRTRSAPSNVALEGYCPVCVIQMKKWVRGTPEYKTSYDGKTYYFPGEQQKEMFLADPAKYVPALSGDCTVCLAKMGKRVPGNIHFASLYDNRLFLFPSADQKREFQAHPDQYANVDLALGGKCTVCRAMPLS